MADQASPITTRRSFLRSTGAALLPVGAWAQAAPVGTRRQPGTALTIAGMAFRWCPPGPFRMGSPLDEAGRRADEAQVEVRFSRGFWMSATEVTQGQWRRHVGDFPDRPPTDAFGRGDTVPVYWVNYAECEQFCAQLTRRAQAAGELPPGWAVRLPTEAQWEYACRAGTTTATAFGDQLRRSDANFDVDGLFERGRPAPPPSLHAVAVGQYRANAWGLNDMHGNVFEWCRDWYHARLPGGVDPDLSSQRGVPNGDGSYSRCRRGGAWNDPAAFCRSAMRLRYEPERRSDHIGFRVVAGEE